MHCKFEYEENNNSILSTNNSAVANIAFTNATHIMVNITYEAA